jgi:hypothetical protein
LTGQNSDWPDRVCRDENLGKILKGSEDHEGSAYEQSVSEADGSHPRLADPSYAGEQGELFPGADFAVDPSFSAIL